eukprot:SM000238S08049  [mRNA]  locus=s238:5626:9885:- [translate_table: standard]
MEGYGGAARGGLVFEPPPESAAAAAAAAAAAVKVGARRSAGGGRRGPLAEARAHEDAAAAESSQGQRLGRALLAGVYVPVVLLLLFCATLPLYMLVAWHFVPDIPLYFDYRYPQPNATATFLPNDVLATALPRAAKARAGKVFNGPHVVPKGQRFRLILNLQLPESSHNRNLGIFQIEAQLLALQGDVLASKSVPTMLRFRSWPVEYGRTFLMALPLLSGFWDDFQTLSLPILEHQEGRRPFVSVKIELAPKAGLTPAVGLPEIYEAEVSIETVLTGFARIFRYWKLTSLVWGFIAFISLELTLLLTCCSRALFPELWGLRPQVEEKVPIAKVVESAQAAVEEYKEAELPPTPDLSDVDEFEDDLMKSLPFELAVLRSRKGRKKSLTIRDQSRDGTLDEDMDDSEAQYEEEAEGEEIEDGEGLWQDPLASILSDEDSEDGEEFGSLGRNPLGLHGDKPRAEDGHQTLGLPVKNDSKDELQQEEASSAVNETIDGGSNVQRSGLPLGDVGKPVGRQLGSEAVTIGKDTGCALGGREGAGGPAHTEGEALYAYHMQNEPGDSGIGYEEMAGDMGQHAGNMRGHLPVSPDAAQSSEDVDVGEKHLEDALEERGRSNFRSASNDIDLEDTRPDDRNRTHWIFG